MTWEKKRKGCADIYRHPTVSFAIVDRRGFGIASAVGGRITYNGQSFKTVDDAKAFALEERRGGE